MSSKQKSFIFSCLYFSLGCWLTFIPFQSWLADMIRKPAIVRLCLCAPAFSSWLSWYTLLPIAVVRLHGLCSGRRSHHWCCFSCWFWRVSCWCKAGCTAPLSFWMCLFCELAVCNVQNKNKWATQDSPAYLILCGVVRWGFTSGLLQFSMLEKKKATFNGLEWRSLHLRGKSEFYQT